MECVVWDIEFRDDRFAHVAARVHLLLLTWLLSSEPWSVSSRTLPLTCQVLFSYGAHGTAELIRTYGFAESSPHSTLTVSHAELIEASLSRLGRSAKRVKAKRKAEERISTLDKASPVMSPGCLILSLLSHTTTPHHTTPLPPPPHDHHHPTTTPHHTTPHHTAPRRTTPHTPHHAAPHHTTPHHTTPHHTTPHHAVPHRTTPHHAAPHRTAPHRTAPHHTTTKHTTPHHTTPRHTTPHRTTTHHTIPYHTIPHHSLADRHAASRPMFSIAALDSIVHQPRLIPSAWSGPNNCVLCFPGSTAHRP